MSLHFTSYSEVFNWKVCYSWNKGSISFYRVACLWDHAFFRYKSFRFKSFILCHLWKMSNPILRKHSYPTHKCPCPLLSIPQEKISILKQRKDHLRLLCYTEPNINRLMCFLLIKSRAIANIKNLFDKSLIELEI